MSSSFVPRSRLASLVTFAAGAMLACVVAGAVAAYDLWGGVPRTFVPFAAWFARGSVLLMGFGAVGFVRSHEPGQRAAAVVRGVGVLALVGLLVGAGLWAHYISRWDVSRRICAPALVAPSRAARDAALREGLGPLFPVIDPHPSCVQLERERRELEAYRTCPTFVMDDVPCRCGEQTWDGRAAPRCASGPTACQVRESGPPTLGCAAHGSLPTLEDARRAEAELRPR